MKLNKLFILASLIALAGCKKLIDLTPQSNISSATYYSTVGEVSTALTGCYNGMVAPLNDEWTLSELRSDNSIQGVPASTSTPNRDLSDLDMFFPSVSHQGNYTFWLNNYYNIRNVNFVLNSLNVNYVPSSGSLNFDQVGIPATAADVKRLSAEATFIRAYHYFNLVRLYGDVFLVHEPISPDVAKTINRSPVADIYKLIIADLTNTINNGSTAKFAAIPSADLGRANSWSAKALLAKVYLTLNRKSEAAALCQDIITNSGYALQASYANVFSINNEMNSEILFAIRFKAGGIGLGSSLPNTFAPLNSGAAIIVGDGRGLNFPTQELYNSYNAIAAVGNVRSANTSVTLTAANPAITVGMPVTGTQIANGTTVAAISGTTLTLSIPANATLATAALLIGGDARRTVNIGIFTGAKFFVQKYISTTTVANDAENDWPVIRYADVILMLAEAQGNNAASIGLINQIRARAGVPALVAASITTPAQFETALANERRWEFAFENQRWYDLLRFSTTFTTINSIQVMKDHFAAMYTVHYGLYPAPRLTLLEMQAFVTNDRMLLPIPQREIDNNTQIVIKQNPGY
ncbi:MAG: RagB/SusD family nutrient uptake outer membrane protein [Sphingobacteriia bacterium]